MDDKCRFCGGYGEPWEFAELGENGIHKECAEYEDEEEDECDCDCNHKECFHCPVKHP